ncbi:hypothetical protein [Aquicoccus sp. SU-CL01552]|uniref:hypothetical protein n=1 Tax=Aquicoccus sp. SU-CL01552 TaxID=3127656 RepID=UPI003106E55E
MKVILFIGHHKVGSTSLQDFLARNSVALAQAGILYPSVDFEGMALMLGAATGRYAPEGVLPINAREPHNALAFRMLAEHDKGKVPGFHKGLPARGQMERAIRKQIEFLRPEAVILAAEVFANFAPADPALIQGLRNIFPPEAEITVIATLRRIDDYLASWHGQRLKFGHKIAPLSAGGLQGYFGNIHFDYRLMLEGWLKEVPEARFVLRDYADVRAAGGSVADFIAQSGLTFPEGLGPEQRTNESLHRGVYELARRGNEVLPGPQAGALRRWLRVLTPELDLPKSSEIELFGEQNRAEMVDRFTPIQQFLGEVSGKAPFFPDLEAARQPLPVPEVEVFRHALARLRGYEKDMESPEISEFLAMLGAEIIS